MDDGHLLDTLKSRAGDALMQRETSELHPRMKLLKISQEHHLTNSYKIGKIA
jgi:hypothetical protein